MTDREEIAPKPNSTVDSPPPGATSAILLHPAESSSESPKSKASLWVGYVAEWLSISALWVVIFSIIGELVILIGSLFVQDFLHGNWPWSTEVSQFAISLIAFIGGPLAYRRDKQPALTILERWLSDRGQRIRRGTIDAIVIALPLAIAVTSSPAIAASAQTRTTYLQFPQSWYTIPIPVGMVLFAIFGLDRFLRHKSKVVLQSVLALALCAGFVALLDTVSGITGTRASLSIAALGVLFVALLVLGVPIVLALLAGAAGYTFIAGGLPISVVVTNMSGGVSDFLLLAVPFFILTGAIMSHGGLSRKISDLGEALLGRFHGGSLHVVVFTMYAFSGLSGSKSGDIAAVSSALESSLRQKGYKPGEIAATMGASAIMGETVPPSITMLILGSITTVSISQLFIGGLLPAGAIGVALMAAIYIRAYRSARHSEVTARSSASGKSVAVAFAKAVPCLLVPIVLLGGIAGGVASPTDVSGLAVILALVLAVAYRSRIRNLRTVVEESAALAGMVLLLVSAASALSWGLNNAGISQDVLTTFTSRVHIWWLFLIATIVIMPIMGLVLEGISAMLVFAPVLVPIAVSLGISPTQYGLVLILSMSLGVFSPPFGWLLHTTAMLCHTTVEETTRPMLRYYVALVAGIVVVAFVPVITLLLPHLILGAGL